MAAPSMLSRSSDASAPLNEFGALLTDVCVALQISGAQYQRAQGYYEEVGAWLAEETSPIARLNPVIYPQGSMALQTTVRPWTDEDSYDLDLVLQVEPTSDAPMTLYRQVQRRLHERTEYRGILEQKRRCLCLNFEDDGAAFHMDILPARLDDVRGGTCIEVPDKRTPERWQPSNPIGYREWFEARAAQLLLEKRVQLPLPSNAPAHAKGVLKQAVQLMKRRRDLMIRDTDLAPRSVVLTTLAAEYYHGEPDVMSALMSILDAIAGSIEVARPGRIVVCNPTNPDERFCESFATDARYEAFTQYIARFRSELRALLAATGFPRIQASLGAMFGEKVTRRALLEYEQRWSRARANGTLIANADNGLPGLLAASHPIASRVVQPHRFSGE